MNDLVSRQSAIDTLKMDIDIIPFIRARQYVREALDTVWQRLEELPSAQPDITDEQAIEHLQKSGWMQNHDKQMYEAGLKERLADDRGSYDALLPSAQSEEGAEWIKPTGMMPPEHHGHYECSNCGFWAMRDWLRPHVVLTKFCPNCGKPMKNGGDNEQD